MKKLAIMIVIILCVSATSILGFAEGVSGGVYTYRIIAQEINDVQSISAACFGELAEKLSFDVEDENSIRYAYTDQSTGYVYDIYIGKNNSGIFSMHKTSEIDRQPLTEAEANANGWAAPAQRTQNGLYTEEEAIEIGYQFLADVVGMDTSCLSVGMIENSYAWLERSPIYRVSYEYRLDGLSVANWPDNTGVVLWVGDNGVEEVETSRIVRFEREEEISASSIVDVSSLQQDNLSANLALTYMTSANDMNRLEPAWYGKSQYGEHYAFDARTGEIRNTEGVW